MPGKIVFKYDLIAEKMSAEGKDFKGATCLKTTEKLMAGLNAKVENRKLKAEYNVQETKTCNTLSR